MRGICFTNSANSPSEGLIDIRLWPHFTQRPVLELKDEIITSYIKEDQAPFLAEDKDEFYTLLQLIHESAEDPKILSACVAAMAILKDDANKPAIEGAKCEHQA